MAGYEVLEIGGMDTWAGYTGGRAPGKRFVEKELPLQYIGMSANAAAPGASAASRHSHATLEELYVFLEGHGEMSLGDDVVPVGPGTVIRVGQGTPRAWHAQGEPGEELRFLCIRAGGGTLSDIGHDGSHDESPLPWA